MKLFYYITTFICVLSFVSCQPTKKMTTAPKAKKNLSSLSQMIDTSAVFTKSFTGFALFDPAKKAYIDSVNYDMYFTPASNTKIFTTYAALQTLGKSIGSIRYVVHGDSLIFWGMGDPSVLNRDFEENQAVIDFLKNRKEKLFYAPQKVGARFGSGWAWDDYNYGFAAECSDMPLYGNTCVWTFEKEATKPSASPSYFYQFGVEESELANDAVVLRDEYQNIFRYTNPKKDRSGSRVIPFRTSPTVTQQLLATATQKPVFFYNFYPSLNQKAETLYTLATDEILQEMMQSSDNLLAEQLLLNISYEKFNTFDLDKTIAYLLKTYFKDSPDKLVWRDGSGVSRYNLFTPRSIVSVWQQLYQEMGEERLFGLLAVGGESGTLKNWYKGEPSPYVYGKTGTLSNQHSLSGFVKTKSGKTLIFSFMNNNYIGNSKALKMEMESVLKAIRDNY